MHHSPSVTYMLFLQVGMPSLPSFVHVFKIQFKYLPWEASSDATAHLHPSYMPFNTAC